MIQRISQRRNFQNFLLLSTALVLALSPQIVNTKKSRASDFFSRGSGVILNPDEKSFEQDMKESDQLIFLYVFDSEGQQSKQMNEQIINPLLDELKGYNKWYAFDCQQPEIKENQRFQKLCENPDYTPFIQLMKPSEVKINPYTKEPMQLQPVQFMEREVTLQKVKSFILNNIPDFSVNIDSVKKLETFRGDKTDQDINRVILFSKKSKTPPVYKALTNLYRDRIRFGFVSSEQEDIVKQFPEVGDKFPSILVLKSYDPDNKTVLESVQTIKYDKKDFKMDELKEFLNDYARSDKKEQVQAASNSDEGTEKSASDIKKERKAKKPYVELYDYRQFNSKILESDKAGLVFYITSQNVTQDVPLFDKIMKQTLGPLTVGVFYVNTSSPDFAEAKQKYKLGNKFPQLRFYKNNLFGDEKNQKSFEIYINKKLNQIIEEVDEGLENDIKEVSEKIFNNLAISHAVEEKKNVIVYFYNDDKISLHFKALSAVKFLKDDYVFMSIFDPSQQLLEGFQMKSLPAMGGILKAQNEDVTTARQFTYGGQIDYEEMLKNLLHIEGKEDEYYKKQKAKAKTIDRKFEEITNQMKFQQNCLDRQKGCAIAFLSGNNQQDYEIQNHKEYLQILEQLENDAKSLPLYYMWVNASCHNYLLEKFDVNPMFIPTVIFYLPEKDKSAHLIGKFDQETIQKHEQKFVNGKLPTFPMKAKSSEIEIKDLDCPNIQLDIGSDSNNEFEDEILKEILEEEKKREEERSGSKKTKKKKKSSKKGSKAKDDL